MKSRNAGHHFGSNAHPAPQVFRIARLARNQVNVQVRHGLAGRGAEVAALSLVIGARQAGALLRRALKERADVLARVRIA